MQGEVRLYLHTSVHCGAVHKAPESGASQCLASDEWILNVHSLPAVLPAIKSNEVVVFAAAWMDLGNILSENRQTQRQIPSPST